MDSLVNQSAKYWYLSNEQARCRSSSARRSAAAAASARSTRRSRSRWFHERPRPEDRRPSTPADAKALLKAAIRDDNPVLFFEHKRLYAIKGEAPQEVADARSARRGFVRAGTDVTLVLRCRASATPRGRRRARRRRHRGRGDRPADDPAARPETIVASLGRTNRLASSRRAPHRRLGGEMLARRDEERALGDIDDVWRIATPDHPIPSSPALEDAFLPRRQRDRRVGRAAARRRRGPLDRNRRRIARHPGAARRDVGDERVACGLLEDVVAASRWRGARTRSRSTPRSSPSRFTTGPATRTVSTSPGWAL